VAENPLVLFMKGTPDLPQCGFSRAVCQILELHGVQDKVVAFNCLEDPELREGIKEYSLVTLVCSLTAAFPTPPVPEPLTNPLSNPSCWMYAARGRQSRSSTSRESLLVDATS